MAEWHEKLLDIPFQCDREGTPTVALRFTMVGTWPITADLGARQVPFRGHLSVEGPGEITS